jgi:hypothetical protein
MIGKKGEYAMSLASVKMPFYVVFVAVITLVVVLVVEKHVSRGVDDADLKFFLDKQRILEIYFDGGESSDNLLKSFSEYGETNPSMGVLIKVGDKEYYSNKDVYQEKAFCKIKDTTHVCMFKPYEDMFIVDGNIEEVKIDIVRSKT